jgi:hypothetical protein
MLAPFAKMDYIIREIAKSMDLDPDKVTNSMQDAAIQAEILKGFQQPAPAPQGMPPEAGGPAPQQAQILQVLMYRIRQAQVAVTLEQA